MKKAKLYKLSIADYAKGFMLAVISSLLTGCQMYLSSGKMPTNSEWRVLAMVAIGAGVAYLLKNFFTNSDDQLLKKEDDSKLKR